MAVTKGTLTFFERQSWPSDQRPYELLFQPPDSDFPVCNYNVARVADVPIHDLRPLKGNLSLDREGFLVADLDTRMEYDDYFNQEKLKSTYVPEIKAFLKEKLSVRAAYVHECVVGRPEFALDAKSEAHLARFVSQMEREAILAALVGQFRTFTLLIEQLTGDKTQAEAIKKSRIQMLNIWKPLRGPLRSWPLALCDLQSLDQKDLVTFDEVHATAVLNSQQIVYNPSQKWYYLSNQEATEILVFKSMDSVVRGEVAHGSFFNPTCPDSEPARESIELRILVMY